MTGMYTREQRMKVLAALVRSQAEEIERVENGSEDHFNAWKESQQMINELRRERDAYKKAKTENDDRFQTELESVKVLLHRVAAGKEPSRLLDRAEQAESSLAAMTKERDEWRAKARSI